MRLYVQRPLMKKRTFYQVATVAIICIFSLALSVTAQRQPEQSKKEAKSRQQTDVRRPRHLEDFDIRANLDRTLRTTSETAKSGGVAGRTLVAARDSRLRRERTSVQMQFNSLTGVPSRVYSFTQDLTQPTVADAEFSARQFLKQNADLYLMQAVEVDGLNVAKRYRTDHNGVTHLTLAQKVNGIDVFQSEYTFHFDRNGALITAGGELIPSAANAVNLSSPRLSANAALRQAADYADVELTSEPTVKVRGYGRALTQKLSLPAKFERDIAARLVYFPLSGNQLRLAWELELWLQETPDVYLLVVDADNGALLYRDNLTWYCAEDGKPIQSRYFPNNAETYKNISRSLPFATVIQTTQNPHGLVFTKDSPRPDAPHTSINPPFVEREDVPFRAMPFNGATIFPANDQHNDWWAGQSPTTFISNNANAYLDRNADNQPDDNPRLTIPDSNFSFPVDFTQQPTTENNQKAALANLFYWTNRYHDILYSFGFNEAAGNFQTNNFGLGGLGNDAVRAEAQDGSGTNNANFSTGSDGSPPRMQMYLFTGGSVLRDGDFEQGIILHELTHGTSNRLIRGLGFAQGGGMGEGWSDYFGLVLMRNQSDDLDGSYPVGGFAINDFANGIRRFPYSTSQSVNPLTFGDISISTEVHDVGEIWCNALLEMRAELIRKLGFQEGQRQSLQLVVDGMKLSPLTPTFLDARNAIMLADKVNNGGVNQCTMWQAFAKRGMGFSATTLDARDGAPQEAFDLPPFCSDLGTLRFNQKAYLPGETIQISLGDHNATGTVRVKVRSSVTGDEEMMTALPDGTFAGAYSLSLRVVNGTAAPGDGALQASLAARDKIVVTYDDANNGSGSMVQINAQADIAGEKIFFDDTVESGNTGWSVTGTPNSTWAITETRAASGSRSWTDSPNGNYAAGTNASLVSPLFDLSQAAGVVLTFAHSYALTAGFDYGIVEFSTDDGVNWNRAVAYTGLLSSFSQVVLKLDALAGQSRARIRFRLISSSPTTNDGWTIDDIRLIARSSDPAFIPPPSTLAPIITGMTPAFGLPSGNTFVTINGLNFTETGDVKVFFNGLAASNIGVLGGTTLTAATPAQPAGKASLRIETRYGAVTLANAFTYYQPGSTTGSPEVSSVFPNSGTTAGDTAVTINGSNFSPETLVLFGTLNAKRVTFVNSNTLRAFSPASTTTGSVELIVRNSTTAETKIANGFSYTAPTPPTVSVISPNGGDRIFTGSTVTLRWQSSDNRKVARHRLSLYRVVNGLPQPFVSIAEVSGETQSFNWTVPQTATTNAGRLRVVAVDDEGAETEVLSAFDFTIESRWQTQTQLPDLLNRAAVASDGRYVYTIGGRSTTSNSSSTTTVQRLDTTSAQPGWEIVAPLPTAFNSSKAVTVNGKIYVPGGIRSGDAIEGNLYVYSIAGNSWGSLASPPQGVHAYGLAANSATGKLYLTGGTDVNVRLGTVQVYDIATNKWSSLPEMNNVRFAHEAVFANGKLYVAGGIGATGSLTSCEVFDFNTQKWSAIADLPRTRQYGTNVLAQDSGGRLLWLIIGGENSNGAPIGAVDAYDFAANKWLSLDGSFDLPTGRTRMSGAAASGFVYVVGGISPVIGGTTPVRTNERLKLDGFSIISPNQPPLVTVPVTEQIALPNNELVFAVSAQDLGSGVPISISAEGLPDGANFSFSNDTNNSARGTFRWTPSSNDIGRRIAINFIASDGALTDVKAVVVKVVQASPLTAVNAADFRLAPLAADSIAAAFGVNLAQRIEVAQQFPLPISLADTVLTVNGIPAPLFFVSPTQINFLVPSTIDLGSATIIVSNSLGSYALGNIQIVAAAPAIFTANATGNGDAAAQATVDGVNFQQPPFDVSVNGQQSVLVLYGTGFRHAAATNPNDANGVAESVVVTIDGQNSQVLYAGAQGTFAGLDQINVLFPASLANQGQRRVEVVVIVGGIEANRVKILIK